MKIPNGNHVCSQEIASPGIARTSDQLYLHVKFPLVMTSNNKKSRRTRMQQQNISYVVAYLHELLVSLPPIKRLMRCEKA